jgi:hypothetical protein
VKALRLTLRLSLLSAALAAFPAAAASPIATCQAELQRGGSAAEDALRACAPVFQESGCQIAWTELLDAPHASPGYGRGPSVFRLANACEKAYCRLGGMGRHPLCTGKSPPPLTAEFFAAWRSFQTEILHREHVSANASERLVQALKLWAGFSPRPGTRTILQAVTRPDVAAVVALTLWNPQGERLGAWVTDIVPEASTLRALVGAVPPPRSGSSSPCIRLEATGVLPAASTEALLKALGTVCRVEMVTVPSV